MIMKCIILLLYTYKIPTKLFIKISVLLNDIRISLDFLPNPSDFLLKKII